MKIKKITSLSKAFEMFPLSSTTSFHILAQLAVNKHQPSTVSFFQTKFSATNKFSATALHMFDLQAALSLLSEKMILLFLFPTN